MLVSIENTAKSLLAMTDTKSCSINRNTMIDKSRILMIDVTKKALKLANDDRRSIPISTKRTPDRFVIADWNFSLVFSEEHHYTEL